MSVEPGNSTGPLSDLKVVDMGSMLAGPLAAGLMADHGAKVIKLEPTGIGDVQRYLGPMCRGISALHQVVNRGKRSLALDLKTAQGLEVFYQLIADADVVLHNFRPGIAAKLGVDYASIEKVNPDIIYLAVTGYGQRGPLAGEPAYDPVIQAFAGVAAGQADPSTGEPSMLGQIFCDKITAHYAYQAVLTALFARERGAGGQEINLSMVDTAVNFQWPDVGGISMFLDEAADPGMNIVQRRPLVKFRDGYAMMAPVKDKHFHGYCAAFNVDSSDPRVKTATDRAANPALVFELGRQVYQNALTLEVDATVELMRERDVPCAKVHFLRELIEHPQLVANQLFVESEHPTAGKVIDARYPANYSKTPVSVGAPSATLGEHTDEILCELGIDTGKIAALREAGIVQ